MYHGQAQARALAHGLGGEEGLKNALQRGGIHAGAVVAHAQGHVVGHGQTLTPISPQAQALAQALVWLDGHRFDVDAALGVAHGLDGMDGVGAQVQQGLFHLRGIGQHWRQPGGQLHVQLNRRGQGHAQQALGVVGHFGQRHGRAAGGARCG